MSKPKFFRLSRQADRDALDERTGAAFRFESPDSYWGKVMLKAKEKSLIVIPDVDCCTAWCLVKDGLDAASMTEAGAGTKFRPATATWALLVSRAWAEKYAVPFFEMTLNDEMRDLSLLEWCVTMGGVSVETAQAAARRYRRTRKNDSLKLDPTDVMRLEAAAEGRAAALAAEAAERPPNAAP